MTFSEKLMLVSFAAAVVVAVGTVLVAGGYALTSIPLLFI